MTASNRLYRAQILRQTKRLVVAFGLVGASASPISAADTPLGNLVEFFFGGKAEEVPAAAVEMVPAVGFAVDAGPGAQYLPLLFKAASRELYYLKKVAKPTEEQYGTLKVAAARASRELAKEYAKAEAAGKSSEQWPRPRRFITDALAKTAAESLPAEAVARYREEVEAREAADVAACQGMMVRAIDSRLTLLPDQYEPMRAAVVKQWKQEQSLNLMIYLYDEYLPLPAVNTLATVLNERQKELMKGESHGRIHFGWEQDLGLQTWNDDGQDLPDLEDLSQVRIDASESRPAAKTNDAQPEETPRNPVPAAEAAEEVQP